MKLVLAIFVACLLAGCASSGQPQPQRRRRPRLVLNWSTMYASIGDRAGAQRFADAWCNPPRGAARIAACQLVVQDWNVIPGLPNIHIPTSSPS